VEDVFLVRALPLSVWSVVFERANRLFQDELNEKRNRANGTFNLLQGAALMHRRFTIVATNEETDASDKRTIQRTESPNTI
jgi:hypothetical protein